MPAIALSDIELKKVLATHALTPGPLHPNPQTIGKEKYTFSSTRLQSMDAKTEAHMIGVTHKGTETRVIVVLKRQEKAVDATIIPVSHPVYDKPIHFSFPDLDGPPPPPDAAFSAGWWGWAVSLSEVEVREFYNAAISGGAIAFKAAVSAIIGHFVWWAGIIAAFILAIGPYLLDAIDNIGGKKGICFVDTWWGVWWITPNPVPWGF
jgi:hypothetical protein